MSAIVPQSIGGPSGGPVGELSMRNSAGEHVPTLRQHEAEEAHLRFAVELAERNLRSAKEALAAFLKR